MFLDDEEKVVETGSFNLRLVSTLSNGRIGENAGKIDVIKPISLIEEVASITYRDTAKTNVISYQTFTAGASIDSLMVSWKNGKLGTYELVDENFSTDEGKIDLKNRDYINNYDLMVGDTLYYKFTVSSGDLSSEVESKTAILAQPVGSSTAVTLSQDPLESKVNLQNGLVLPSSSMEGEIAYIKNETGVISAGFQRLEDVPIDFIQFTPPNGVTADQYYERNDILLLETDFMAGTIVENGTFDNVQKDDLFLYRALRPISNNARESEFYYGILKIDEVSNINNGESITFDFSFRENNILK